MALAALTAGSGFSPAPDARVVKAADYQLLVEAEDILAKARERGEAIVREAEEHAEELRAEARAEGLEEGKAEVAERLFEVVTASVEQLSSMENAIVDMVVKSVRTIIGEFDREELAVKAVGHALRLVRDEKRVVLRVAAADADMVNARLAEIVALYPGMGRVDVRADGGLSRGGCILETEAGVIDATLERQLGIIEDTFKRHLEERPSR
jgi:type III secretion protein L